jgi:hypothetical protein
VNNKTTFAEAATEAYKIHNSLVFGGTGEKGPWQIVSVEEKETL